MPVATMSSHHDRPRVTGSEHEYGTCNKITNCKINSLYHVLYGYLILGYWSSDDRRPIIQWYNLNDLKHTPYNTVGFQRFYFHKLALLFFIFAYFCSTETGNIREYTEFKYLEKPTTIIIYEGYKFCRFHCKLAE